jgi:hypothetical protein
MKLKIEIILIIIFFIYLALHNMFFKIKEGLVGGVQSGIINSLEDKINANASNSSLSIMNYDSDTLRDAFNNVNKAVF